MSQTQNAEPVASPTLTKTDIVRAATNDPALALSQFTLGDKTYQIVDLSYDEYLVFVSMLQPVLDHLLRGAAGKQGISLNGVDVPAPSFSTADLLKYCKDDLPKMVQIVCKASDSSSELTIEQIKEQAKNPFRLADIVLLQILQNGIIRDVAGFFRTILPILKTSLM